MRGCVLVSVVIPTRGRPRLVVHAVESALRQSYALLEVIVVIDGPDPETARVLQAIDDERLNVITLEENCGGSEARNVGVRAAQGEWIALLDDDDQWTEGKLDLQMMAASNIQARYPIISSRLCVESRNGNRILPRRLYTTGENVAEYLFCRNGFSYGEGMLQTSTLLAKRDLLLDVSFRKGLKRHQDWDWLLRAVASPNVQIVMLPQVLTRMRVDEQGRSVSQAPDWRPSLAWAKEVRSLMSARAYTFFIATECVPRARECRAGLKVQLLLFLEFVWSRCMGTKQLALFLAFCLFSERLHRKLSKRLISIGEWKEVKQT